MENENKPENPSAFPEPFVNDPRLAIDHTKGMTLRDYFAAKAMQGIIAHYGFEHENNGDGHSKKAYYVADAMLKQREI